MGLYQVSSSTQTYLTSQWTLMPSLKKSVLIALILFWLRINIEGRLFYQFLTLTNYIEVSLISILYKIDENKKELRNLIQSLFHSRCCMLIPLWVLPFLTISIKFSLQVSMKISMISTSISHESASYLY
jgi:hypothetical protein